MINTVYNIKNGFRRFGLLSLLIFALPAAYSEESEQLQDYNLTLNPQKCVSLRQGQTCYLDIDLSWSAKSQGDYCLFASNSDTPLKCWQQSQQGHYKAEFSNNENTLFYLKSQQKTLAQVELKMAWVYKRKRSSISWRVF